MQEEKRHLLFFFAPDLALSHYGNSFMNTIMQFFYHKRQTCLIAQIIKKKLKIKGHKQFEKDSGKEE